MILLLVLSVLGCPDPYPMSFKQTIRVTSVGFEKAVGHYNAEVRYSSTSMILDGDERTAITWGDAVDVPLHTLRPGMLLHTTTVYENDDTQRTIEILDDPIGDLEFELAQEAWVRDSLPEATRWEYLKPHTRHLIGLLGSLCYHCREVACESIRTMPRSLIVWSWATAHPDPQVRDTANRMIAGIKSGIIQQIAEKQRGL